jgi:DNA-binding response OmpR family regulator
MKMLVIDDEQEIVSMMVDWLSRRGHSALGITGGADAVDWVRREEIQVVLLDIVLPDVDGLALLSDIVAAGAQVIVFSGYRELDKLNTSAAVACMRKPIDFSELQTTLESLG